MTGRFFFIGAKNTDDLRDLTLNNFTLCRGDGLHDPNMPFGKRRYVPRGSHPWKFSPRKVGPSFPAWCVCFPPLLLRGKKQLHWISGFRREKTLTKISSEVSVKSGKFLRFFFHLFAGQIFSPMDSESLGASPFFVVSFEPPRLLKQSQRRQEFGGFSWGEIEGSVKGGISCGSGSGKRISQNFWNWCSTLRLKMEDGRNMEKASLMAVIWIQSKDWNSLSKMLCWLVVATHISDFHPDLWGNDPIWRSYFSNGLVQPPTSCWLRFRIPAFCFEIVQRLNALPVEETPWNLGKLPPKDQDLWKPDLTWPLLSMEGQTKTTPQRIQRAH